MTRASSLPLALSLVALLSGTAMADAPRVVASIKPVHALVAAVMGDLGTPALLVSGGASPHTYSLKPSDARALQEANLVFWTGHGLELFLADSLQTLAPGATHVELADAPGLQLLPVRAGGMFEGHDHGDHAEDEAEGHDHEGHDQEGHDDHHDQTHEEHDAHGDDAADMHFFLDPANAEVMTRAIAEALATADPEHAATYAANADAAIADLEALSAETAARLAPMAGRPLVVFHDALQYFGNRFALDIVGSVTVTPELAPGADRISDIRSKLAALDAACVFAEPQFDPRIIDVLVEGSDARAGVLDPEGADLEPGPGLYRALIESLADGVLDCLN